MAKCLSSALTLLPDAGVATGQLDESKASEAVIRMCLRNVERWNPLLNALTGPVNRTRLPQGLGMTLLQGAPIVVKDNISTGWSTPTTLGSKVMVNYRLPEADVVRRLRRSGAVVLGKSSLTEWCNLVSSSGVSGRSTLGGQCRNPHDPERSPGGSSSGTAVAVAAGMAVAGLGTETMGSVMAPAGLCGVVGLKPSRGLLPTGGIAPAVPSFDTVGLITRTVRGAARFLSGASCGPSYEEGLRQGALRGMKLGFFTPDGLGEEKSLWKGELERLRDLGAEMIEVAGIPDWEHSRGLFYEMVAFELRCSFSEIASSCPGGERGLDAFGRKLEESLGGEADILRSAMRPGRLSLGAYGRRRRELALRYNSGTVLGEGRLDGLVLLTNRPARPIAEPYNERLEASHAACAALSGLPAVTVPAGRIEDLPVGVTFVARVGSERSLLAMAFDYESASSQFRPAKLTNLDGDDFAPIHTLSPRARAVSVCDLFAMFF